jgi:hypothetical protein
MKRFIIFYFNGDGYTYNQFDSIDELNDYIKFEDIIEQDIEEIIEVTVNKVIFEKS